MTEILTYIQSNVAMAPYLIFGLLLMAGFNLPVSEDVMIFISATLAAKSPEYLPHLFVGVYLGAFFSDLICFQLGYRLGPKLFEIKFFANMVTQDKIDKINNFYKKYGVMTLLLGRFIPFGVRNALFLTAGLGKMNFLKFALSDLVACTISVSLFFTLYYKIGEAALEYVKQGNKVLFAVALVIVGAIIFVSKKKKTTAN